MTKFEHTSVVLHFDKKNFAATRSDVLQGLATKSAESLTTLGRVRLAQVGARAIDAVDPSVLLVGRNENFRVPGMSAADSIARAVAYAEAGADCLFVPTLLDAGAIAELVAAVAPKPVNVLVRDFDESIRSYAALGVRRCSVGGGLARRAWAAFDQAAQALKRCEAQANQR